MRRSMPVPTTLRSQGCALATPPPMLMGFSYSKLTQLQIHRRHSLLAERNKLPPPETFVLHCLRHTTDRTRAQTVQGCPTRVPVWTSYFLPRLVMQNETQPSTKPAATFRYRGISASVFENHSEKGDPYYKVAIVRTYKDGKNGFKSTPTFSRDELPLVIKVAQQAFDFILVTERDNRVESDNK
ncbi:MAG: hypothetical protein AB8G99_20355 [Planctomycetaceae bacterium]